MGKRWRTSCKREISRRTRRSRRRENCRERKSRRRFNRSIYSRSSKIMIKRRHKNGRRS